MRCISLMCSATFSIPFNASASARMYEQNGWLARTSASSAVCASVCECLYTYRQDASALRTVNRWDCVAAAAEADTWGCAESVWSDTIPTCSCAAALDCVRPGTPAKPDCPHLSADSAGGLGVKQRMMPSVNSVLITRGALFSSFYICIFMFTLVCSILDSSRICHLLCLPYAYRYRT